jgi:hypothetical protein
MRGCTELAEVLRRPETFSNNSRADHGESFIVADQFTQSISQSKGD